MSIKDTAYEFQKTILYVNERGDCRALLIGPSIAAKVLLRDHSPCMYRLLGFGKTLLFHFILEWASRDLARGTY
jgi:hypothetical protein